MGDKTRTLDIPNAKYKEQFIHQFRFKYDDNYNSEHRFTFGTEYADKMKKWWGGWN